MDRYEPPSDFLKSLSVDENPLIGEEAESNLKRLIELTRDEHPINRDWATFLLALVDIDTTEIRDALLISADDKNAFVRAEAILGLAQRDKSVALPLLQRELHEENVALPIFEAAEIVADATLVHDLREFSSPSGDSYFDKLTMRALAVCEAAD